MKTANKNRLHAGVLSLSGRVENPINYPFYCIEKKVYCTSIINVLTEDNVWLYVWSMIHGTLSIYFLKEKMHVFPILINRGFNI